MLMSKCSQVKLQKTYKKILYLYEAYNETFVFLGMLGVKQDCIVHVDKTGKQLFCHVFHKPMETLNMITEYQAVTLETRANCITIIDLRTYEFKLIQHYFMSQQSDQVQIYTFPDSKYFTVVQWGKYNDNQLKLTYLNYPRKNPQIKIGQPLHFNKKQLLEKQFFNEDGLWTYEHIIRKCNNHSMIIWFKPRNDQFFQLRLFYQQKGYRSRAYLGSDQKDNRNGWEYKQYKIDHKLSDQYLMNHINLAINQIFQVQDKKLVVFCMTNRQRTLNQPSDKVINNNYMIDLLTQTVQQTKHDFGKLHDYQIDQYLLGNCHMIRFFQFKSQKSIQSPIYYLSNENFQLISQQKWICSHLNKYTFPGYDSKTMIQTQYQNINVCNFKCYFKKIMEFKEIALFFLLEMYKNFDDDLLNDVIGLLEWE